MHALHLVQYVKVILDVFQRTVVGQLVQQRLSLLLSGHAWLQLGITSRTRTLLLFVVSTTAWIYAANCGTLR